MTFSKIEPLEARIAPATLTFANPTAVVEGNSGTKTLTFTATLDEVISSGLTLTFSTRNGTAVAGSDYVAKTETKTFGTAANSLSTTFTVTLNGDANFEATESFFVNVTGDLTGVTFTNANPIDPTAKLTAKGTILNDDRNQLATNKVQWIDVDGDLVTMTVNRSSLPISNNNSNTNITNPLFTFSATNALGGSTLQQLDLFSYRSSFAGASITITATKQPGFEGISDGRVDIGFLRASIFDPSELQVVGIDLGTVTIDGDLGRIYAGDQFSTPAIGRLDVYSLGARGPTTQPSDASANNSTLYVESKILGPIGTVRITDSVKGWLHVIGAEFGNIGTLTVGGAIEGGSVANSGVVSVSGRISAATVGSIIGGSGASSGLLLGSFTAGTASLGTVKVLGEVKGGDGADSGAIEAPRLGNLSIGKLTGGKGTQSGYIFSSTTIGSVTIGSAGSSDGDVTGGEGQNSGQIASNTSIGAVVVHGDLLGGKGTNTGSIRTGGGLASARVTGALIGGEGEGSGSLQMLGGGAGAISVGENSAGKSILGGSGKNSGWIRATGNVTSVTTTGAIEGGTGTGSGGVLVDRTLGKALVDGNLQGGNSTANAFLDQSGYIIATTLPSLTINGDVRSGIDNGGGIASSGSIRADVIGSLIVNGSVVGNKGVNDAGIFTPVIISARGFTKQLAIGSLKVDGDARFAEILAGYDATGTSTQSSGGRLERGSAVNGDASIGTIEIGGNVRALNIVAGAVAGSSDRFGGTGSAVIAAGNSAINSAALRSSIASVIIKGSIEVNPDTYGIVAQEVKSVVISSAGTPAAPTPVSLTPGASNNTTPVAIGGADRKFFVVELPAG